MPDFTRWPSFPFEGDMRVKPLAAPVEVEPPRSGEDAAECVACGTPDGSYIWVSERWRVRTMDRPTGLPMVLILECRSHLDLGDLPNLLAAELGVMTVRLERAIRSLDGVARVHVNRWGDGSAHLHLWFLARPYGRLQLRGTFLSLWDDILPVIPEQQWRENLALVAAWLAEFGGQAIAEPPHIQWQAPSTFTVSPDAGAAGAGFDAEEDLGTGQGGAGQQEADVDPGTDADPGTGEGSDERGRGQVGPQADAESGGRPGLGGMAGIGDEAGPSNETGSSNEAGSSNITGPGVGARDAEPGTQNAANTEVGAVVEGEPRADATVVRDRDEGTATDGESTAVDDRRPATLGDLGNPATVPHPRPPTPQRQPQATT
ncbi:hypothetical protein [Paractinoplanes rishiriensis]|uniref:hypothetical protein n=1 Tax=Paractinoplanes rishiriensis TaxID=1050105 RepID=UPI001EF1F85F|nr:hypothetical protein [Actinoplanes rishiriensis]